MWVKVCLALASVWLAVAPAHAERYRVSDQDDYARVLKHIKAGDVIVLANGEWRDFDLVITGQGREDAPISLLAENAGRVFLTGQSSLRVGGAYVVVSGLVFRDGYSSRGEVISFRRSKDDLATNSRVTQVVIDNFSKLDRYDDDYWVGLYGRNNRFDHNHLVGKTNKGVTLAVRLDTLESRDNGHRIDHNYFGPRPVLGSNGGETIRIGISTYSMFRSGTLVEANVFDRCDGEVEIISSKSGGNIYRGNLFLQSRGTLTLRHGGGNLVERNVFLGRGKDYTGGIRVINRNQTVRDNYMEGLRGTGFASALTVMNGVPNSPVNRYVQVKNALIVRNTIVDSAQVALGAGASEERSAAPSDSALRANLFSGVEGKPLFRVDADMSGVVFDSNVVANGSGEGRPAGIKAQSFRMVQAVNGLLYPTDPSLAGVGAPRDLAVPDVSEVGVSWYPRPSDDTVFGASGHVKAVFPGDDTLFDAVADATSGDILTLQPGKYIINKTIPLDKAVTIRGAASAEAEASVILLARPTLIELQQGGNVQLQDLTIDGSLAPDTVGSSVIRMGSAPIKSNMTVELSAVTVRNLSVNASFNVVTLGKNALADHIVIKNSRFRDITGMIVSAASESDDYGQYNVEYLDITGNRFDNIGGPIAAVYRGGTDESTFGPTVRISDNGLYDVGRKMAGGKSGSLFLHGVQTAMIERNVVDGSGAMKIVHTVGTPETALRDNKFVATPAPAVTELNFAGSPRVLSVGNTRDGKPL